jgi:pimeloyl-ACP methyl ester carboxylesterase
MTSGAAQREPETMIVALSSGERLHYLDWQAPPDAAIPSERARFVLLHGLARTAWSWLPVARRLAIRHEVVAPDLRGHGASDAPRSGYELRSLALDILTVMAGRGWGEAVLGPAAVVAGHGLGAMVAVEMARLQPGSVLAVALLDAGWEDMAQAPRMLPMQLVEAMTEPPEVMASMEAYLADRRAFDPGTWDADQERAARAQVVEKHAGHVGLVTRGSVIRKLVDAMYAYQPLVALTEVSCPISVLVADETTADDEDRRERMMALDDVQRARAAAGLGAIRVLRFPRAGHELMRYRPGEVVDELERMAAVPS